MLLGGVSRDGWDDFTGLAFEYLVIACWRDDTCLTESSRIPEGLLHPLSELTDHFRLFVIVPGGLGRVDRVVKCEF